MLLPSIFITVVVCTVEICEFLSALPLFICPSRPWDNLSPVSRDTCDNCSHFEASFFYAADSWFVWAYKRDL